jgi:hypothetical protein
MSHVWASNVGKYAAHTDAGLVKGVVRYFNGDLDWRLISTAPYNRDVELRVASRRTASRLPFPCHQTNGGWINSDLGTRVDVAPTHWRAWPEE